MEIATSSLLSYGGSFNVKIPPKRYDKTGRTLLPRCLRPVLVIRLEAKSFPYCNSEAMGQLKFDFLRHSEHGCSTLGKPQHRNGSSGTADAT